MYITKANKLTETKYVHLLDVAKTLREVYMRMSKGRCYRVYTEARAKGLRSKMCLGNVDVKSIIKLNNMAKTMYPHLDIVVEQNTGNRPWSFDSVCIFVKVKN
jgi:hypothetical protein